MPITGTLDVLYLYYNVNTLIFTSLYMWDYYINNISYSSRVWEYGGYASKGLEQVAKWGSPRALESELKAQSLHIRTIIKARGLWFPNHNGKTFAVFRTDRKNHLVSLVCFTLKFKTQNLKS